jgi:spore maturation protein CgeB
MKVVFVGPLFTGGTSLQRYRAFQDLGHEMTGIDTSPPWGRRLPPLVYRIFYKLLDSPDLQQINRKIKQAIKDNKYDILWIEKGLFLKLETLKKVKKISPETLIMGYSPDDMGAKHNQSKKFLDSLPFYDWYCTTKTYNVPELKNLGCPRVIFTDNAYDPHTHRPMELSIAEKGKFGGSVGFVGNYEEQRAESIYFLAKHGIQVGVWGNGWEINTLSHPNLLLKGPAILGDDYARSFCAFDICLSFLRKVNRDLQTTRSIEIPACGAFMLAERSSEHLGLFEEGKEAEFFGTNEELLEKIRYYLVHDGERKQIARAGRERCLKSGYSYQERLREILLNTNKI